VAVVGASMEPTLHEGDWLLVDPEAYRSRPPRVGELVLVADPRLPERQLVKRVIEFMPDDRLRVAGDSPGASTDSRTFGPVDPLAVSGRPWFRYWPPRRIGRVS
jgi:signal peptidase I